MRAARYGSWELSASSPEVTLAALRLRKGARFTHEYDLNNPWRHEVRIEDHIAAEPGKTYPCCTGGGGACPPEDCGGPEGYLAGLDTLAEILGEVVSDGRIELLKDEETRCAWSNRSAAPRRGDMCRKSRSRSGPSTRACARASTASSWMSKADSLGPALGEQFGVTP